MFILKFMLAFIATIFATLLLLGLVFLACVFYSKAKNNSDDRQYELNKAKYPDYYKKQEEYDALFAEASRFHLENIENKKFEIDRLVNEIKYLPAVHTVTQQQEIEKLKQEIYENTWTYKKMDEKCQALKAEMLSLREKYKIQ